jgi:antibiotic biosynthesis monooxygenase (ABM) superfamily enzyme
LHKRRQLGYDWLNSGAKMESSANLNSQAQTSGSPAALVTTMRLRPGVDAEFSSWHARMCTVASGVAGFVSAEVNAPAPPGRPEWSVVQHFRSAEELKAWRASEQHGRLLQEASSLVDGSDAQALHEDEVAEGFLDGGTVTEVVTTYVKPGKDREYQEWAEKIHRAEAQFPGYRGGLLQPPASDRHRNWTTLVRFATPAQLDAWLNSTVRQDLLREHDALVQSWEHHRLPNSFAGWFPTDAGSGESPPTWKQSMLVLMMLFPIIMFELRFLSPLLNGLNPSPATFIGNLLSVVLLGWPFMPIIIPVMSWWLLPRKDGAKWINPAGIALLIALYAVEIVVLSHLL